MIVIIAAGECGYTFETDASPDDFDVTIYHVDSMRELAEQFVDDGLEDVKTRHGAIELLATVGVSRGRADARACNNE